MKSLYQDDWGAKGESARRAKLSDAQVIELRKRAKAGEDKHKLAREYGISRNYVDSLARRVNRTDV